MDSYSETIDVYEQISRSYVKGVRSSYPAELPAFIALLQKGDQVLEVGTAGGRDARIFTDAGMEVTGTDVIDSFLEQARKLVPEATFRNKDMRELDFLDQTFDAIWANAVLLHAKRNDVPDILQGFYRILRPGGKVHVRVKEGKGEEYREEKLSDNKKRFFAYYSQQEMEKLLKDAGFNIVRSEIMDDERGREDTRWVSVWAEKASK